MQSREIIYLNLLVRPTTHEEEAIHRAWPCHKARLYESVVSNMRTCLEFAQGHVEVSVNKWTDINQKHACPWHTANIFFPRNSPLFNYMILTVMHGSDGIISNFIRWVFVDHYTF